MPNLATVDATSASTPTPVDSDPNPDEALRRARASSIATTPATVALCRADYAAGADVRATFTRQHTRRR